MFFKYATIVALLLCTATTTINAEPPLGAPYPAAGFRPSRPFDLPRDYLPPVVNEEFEPQLQQPQPQSQSRQPQFEDVSQQQAYDIELRKQRVDFVGQVQDNALVPQAASSANSNRQVNRPHNEYLPPTTRDDGFLKVQALPQPGRPLQFVQAPPLQQSVVPQRQFQQRPQRPRPAQPQAQQQEFFPQSNADLSPPAQQYGAPDLTPEPRRLQADVRVVSAQEEENRAAIDALNAAAEAYNRAQANRAPTDDDNNNHSDSDDNDQVEEDGGNYPASYSRQQLRQQQQQQQRGSRFTKGQYYVLGPDNTVQRVMFSTTQDEQDQRNNGFTAKLRYTPVGEVRDPVFKYNNQGQLVRLFK